MDLRPSAVRLAAIAKKLAHALRDVWLIAGITLLLFVALEFGYSAQARIRTSFRTLAQSSVAHPHANEPWFRQANPGEGGGSGFDPYRVYWGRWRKSTWVNVDSLGRRITPQDLDGERQHLLFLLGGSTLWGWPHIDSLTIGAFLARDVKQAGLPEVEIQNYAQSGYTLTQGLITLMLEIRKGNVPDAAIFLDGANDVGAAFANARAGSTSNEALSAEAYRLGRRRFTAELTGLARHSQLIRRLRAALGERVSLSSRAAMPELCDDIGDYYRQLIRMALAVGRAYDIDMVFFFQPLMATSRKPLTAWESSRQAFDAYRTMQRRCASVVDSLMATENHENYLPLHNMFDDDTVDVFLDGFGHLTVYGNAQVARRMAEATLPHLRARASRNP